MSYNKVKNMYWVGSTFVIELDDGSVMQYHNASIKDIKYEYKSDKEIEQDGVFVAKQNS